MLRSKFNIDFAWKKLSKNNLTREKQICVNKHVIVPITFTQERQIQQNVTDIEDRDHGD
jgi:hypothetical protein